jgi:hypothetical protein
MKNTRSTKKKLNPKKLTKDQLKKVRGGFQATNPPVETKVEPDCYNWSSAI